MSVLVSSIRRVHRLAVAVLALAPGLSPAADGLAWRIERGDVRIVVPLKPGGAFEAKTSALSGNLKLGASKPLPLSGEIRVDLTTIETGISLRNRHLRDNYLEVGKGRGYDQAVLSQLSLSDADGAEFQGRTGFSGTLLLHGVTKPIAGTAEIRRAGSAVHVEARFALTLTDFDIEPPQYMGVGVANKLAMTVTLIATPARGGAQ